MESDIQKDVKEYLQKSGWFVYKNHVSGVKTKNGTVKNYTSGIADLTAIKNKRILMIELKSKTGRQREDQKIFESNWKEKGGEYYVVRSVEELINIISC